MKKRQNALTLAILVVLVAILLVLLNPTKKDFTDHMGPVGLAYARHDYVVFSTYTLDVPVSRVHLGIAKLFVRLK